MTAIQLPTRRFVPRRTGDATSLGHLEQVVMEVIWSRAEPLKVTDVHAALPFDRPVTYNTVKTTLERLAQKGILDRTKFGKAYLYRAVLTRVETERRIVEQALDELVVQFPRVIDELVAQSLNLGSRSRCGRQVRGGEVREGGNTQS